MKLIDEAKNIEIKVKNCIRPKFGGRGRTWDALKVVYINGEETSLWCDTTWGLYCYFTVGHNWNNNKRDGKWYKFEIWESDQISRDEQFKLVRGK